MNISSRQTYKYFTRIIIHTFIKFNYSYHVPISLKLLKVKKENMVRLVLTEKRGKQEDMGRLVLKEKKEDQALMV